MGDRHFRSRERTISTGVGDVGDLGSGADLAHEVHRVGVCAHGAAFLGLLGIQEQLGAEVTGQGCIAGTFGVCNEAALFAEYSILSA